MTQQADSYQPDERLAIVLFNRMGHEYINVQLNKLCDEAQQRYSASYEQYGSIPVGYTALDFLNDTERQERHLLQLALMLCVDERKEAHQRIITRRETMKARRRRDMK